MWGVPYQLVCEALGHPRAIDHSKSLQDLLFRKIDCSMLTTLQNETAQTFQGIPSFGVSVNSLGDSTTDNVLSEYLDQPCTCWIFLTAWRDSSHFFCVLHKFSLPTHSLRIIGVIQIYINDALVESSSTFIPGSK